MSEQPEPAPVKWWLAERAVKRSRPRRNPLPKPTAPAMQAAPEPQVVLRPPRPPPAPPSAKPKPLVLKDLRLLGEALAVTQESDQAADVTDAVIVEYIGKQGRKLRDARYLFGLDYSTLVAIMERNGWKRGWYLVAAYKGATHDNGQSNDDC